MSAGAYFCVHAYVAHFCSCAVLKPEKAEQQATSIAAQDLLG